MWRIDGRSHVAMGAYPSALSLASVRSSSESQERCVA
jgi:hypothetical protein